MAADLHPPELARLVDVSERPRVHDWSFRAALTRYGQPQPERTSAVIGLLRRVEFALKPHMKHLEASGPAVWEAVGRPRHPNGNGDQFVVDLLRALVELDRLGDALAAWAVDRRPDRPDAMVDEVVADVRRQLDDLGVAREEARPPGRRGRG